MEIVANDVREKQRELEELGRERDNSGGSDDDPQVQYPGIIPTIKL